MGRPNRYPDEFRREAVAERDEMPGALDADERAELARLRQENRELKMDREILRKAAAFFARETNR